MRVLHILTDTNIGGAGKYLLALAESKTDFAPEIKVILPPESKMKSLLEDTGIEVTEDKNIAEKSFSLKAIVSLLPKIIKIKPRIVHTHASFAGRCAAKLLGIPVVHTKHYCIYPMDIKQTRFPHKQFQGFINHNFSDKVIATSPEVEKGLVETGTRESHIKTIFNGIAPLSPLSKEEKQASREMWGIKPHSYIISQVARLDEIKGHDHTLDAAKLLADEDIVFLLAGTGPLEEHLNKRIKDEAIDNVIMTGFVSNVAELLSITDIQINMSYTETTCIALLEGMSLSLPSIATKGGGNPYVIKDGENGLLIDCGDSAALAEAIIKLKNSPEIYDNMALNAASTYVGRFKAEKMAEELFSVYMRLLK